jgi:nucleotide-binding universal stress UspA family protein
LIALPAIAVNVTTEMAVCRSISDLARGVSGSFESGPWTDCDDLTILSRDHLLRGVFDEQGSHRMYANILLSTDGSDVARKGVMHGTALAKALGAKVTIVTVTEPLPVDYGSGHASGLIPSQQEFDAFEAANKERARRVLDEARAVAEQIGISVELLHVPNSHPATAIIETARSRGCDLIVMGSHGRRGLRKLFLGSQTSEVLADGSVPVLVVH